MPDCTFCRDVQACMGCVCYSIPTGTLYSKISCYISNH